MRFSLVILIALFFIVQIGGLVWYFQDELRESSVGLVESGLVAPIAESTPKISMPGGPITESDNPRLGLELLEGEVVLPEGLAPGAVEVIADQRPMVSEQILNSHHRRPRWRTELDAKGRFQFDTLEPGSYVLTARSHAHHGTTIIHLGPQSIHPPVVLSLVESRSLRGRILDPTGEPLVRAMVYPFPPASAEEASTTWPYAWWPEESDLSGYFNFAHLPEGPIRFLAVHSNFANHLTEPVEDFAQDLEIMLDAGLEATLVLQNPQGNITRTKLRLTELELDAESHAGHTGPGGLVTFSKLRPAKYRVSVESDRYALEEGAFDLEVGPDISGSLEATVIRGGTIRGQVLSKETGAGLQDVRVEVHGPHGPEVLTVHTDRGGYYRFAGLTPGTYRVTVQPGTALLIDGPGEAEIEVHKNDRSAGPVFVLKPGIPVKGVVKTREGTAVARAEVLLNLSGNDAIDRAVRTNMQGAFAFEGIPEEATVRIWARADEAISQAFGPASPGAEGLPNIELIIEHTTTAMIRGEVLDQAGAPVAGAIVRLAGPEKILPVPRETTTDAWGTFRFEGLAPGDYHLSANTEDGEPTAEISEAVSLADGAAVVTNLQLP